MDFLLSERFKERFKEEVRAKARSHSGLIAPG
jgi:hypothetical protein